MDINYPDNAQPGALDAPWNRPEVEAVCDACGYVGQQDEGEECEECGEGTICFS